MEGRHGPWRWRPAWGTLASLPPRRPALSLLPQMMMNAVPSPAPVPTATASTPWAASTATVTRATSPAPASPSARVSVTKPQCGTPTWELTEAGTGSERPRGYPASPDTCVHHTPPASLHPFSHHPPKGENMSLLPCPSSHPGRGPPQVHHFMGLNLEGTPVVPGVRVTYLSWSPVSLSPSLSTLSAPGAQSPPLSFRPSVCIQLPPAPPQPPRPPDAAHPRTSSVPAPRTPSQRCPASHPDPQASLPK